MAEPEQNLSSIMLSLPAIEGHERFSAVVELVGRYLCLFRGDGSFGLVHFYPEYEREKVHPVGMPAYGHLPPMSWCESIVFNSCCLRCWNIIFKCKCSHL